MPGKNISYLIFMIFLIGLPPKGQGSTFIITNTNDTGAGTLRQAMKSARSSAGPDTIIFDIPTSDPNYDLTYGVWRIMPASELPQMWETGTFIDGTTQAAFIGGDPNPHGPEIVVDGINVGDATGFYIIGTQNHLRTLTIQRFNYGLVGIWSDSNKVTGCFIGTDVTGEQRLDNYQSGISIGFGAYNIIGGFSPEERNVISGNQLNGIMIYNNSTKNQIIGNYIGINSSATDTLGNGVGIRISDNSHYNTIGPNNIISGNKSGGIIIQQNSDHLRIFGNLIGTSADGAAAWGNEDDGISITDGSSQNIIGGTMPEDRNIISGNVYAGISLYMVNSDSNQILGNYIGTDITGNVALPNEWHGITIRGGSKYNIIGGEIESAGNVISANSGAGIWIYGDSNNENKIIGNLIGTGASGTQPLGNAEYGIEIEHNSHNNLIGPHNTIAFNGSDGILIGNYARGNTITQNSIFFNDGVGIHNSAGGNNELQPPAITGINPVKGTAPANALVEIFSGPDDQGKTYEDAVVADAAGNFHWAGSFGGDWLTATATDEAGNTSEFSIAWHVGNFMVTTTADTGEGSLRWAIEQANITLSSDSILFDIPGSDPGFNGTVWMIQPITNLPDLENGGTVIDGCSQTRNQGDTNPNGPEIMINGSYVENDYSVGFGIYSAENVICGLVISGFNSTAIEIYFEEAHHNHIWGNYIGTTADGADTLGNRMGIIFGSNANFNIIGGTESTQRNVISGNLYSGIEIFADNNIVIGNYIGTDALGLTPLKNHDCAITVGTGSEGNRIGGIESGEGNVLSGNAYYGVRLSGVGTEYNIVQGNIIGLNANGDAAIANSIGIYISGGAKNNTIGGSESSAKNIISGNLYDGMYLGIADSNQVVGNYIGADVSGKTTIGNGNNGINLYYRVSHNVIGGLEDGEANLIVGNAGAGINIGGDETTDNRIMGNYIGTDETDSYLPNLYGGISIHNGPQHNQIGPRNVIRYNNGFGVNISNLSTLYNTITQNSISNNESGGIQLSYGGNSEIEAPMITGKAPISGTAIPYATVEIFSDSTDQGRYYEATVTADGAGNFVWHGTPTCQFVTATATDDSGNTSEFSNNLYIAVEEKPVTEIPAEFTLFQNHPNPFNPTTIINYQLAMSNEVQLFIYNTTGQLVRVLVNEFQTAGKRAVVWDGLNDNGERMSSGLYLYQIKAGKFTQCKKMLLVQ